MNNLITKTESAGCFLGFLSATALAGHVNDRPKLLLIILARRQHDRLLKETVDSIKHVLTTVSDVCYLMESLHDNAYTKHSS